MVAIASLTSVRKCTNATNLACEDGGLRIVAVPNPNPNPNPSHSKCTTLACEDGGLRIIAVQADLVTFRQRARVGPGLGVRG